MIVISIYYHSQFGSGIKSSLWRQLHHQQCTVLKLFVISIVVIIIIKIILDIIIISVSILMTIPALISNRSKCTSHNVLSSNFWHFPSSSSSSSWSSSYFVLFSTCYTLFTQHIKTIHSRLPFSADVFIQFNQLVSIWTI